jgi:hypothetical protein
MIMALYGKTSGHVTINITSNHYVCKQNGGDLAKYKIC